MKIDQQISEDIYRTLESANNILIISHRNPDPDCLGSNLALRYILQQKGKNITSACIDEIPHNYKFFTELNHFFSEINPKDHDLFITLDCGSPDQAGLSTIHPELLKLETPLINIDHHPSNNNYGTINLVCDEAASTTTILYFLFKDWQIEITPYIATCLLFGLYYDTGSFMHQSTDEEVLQTASDLMSKGANHQLIIKNLFKSHSIEQLKVWGKALSNARITDNKVIVSGVMERDFEECNASSNDLSGLIDYLSSVNGTRFATVLSHDIDDTIRGSLRTRRDDVNVSEIAKNFGGGGHKKASGFSMKGKLNKRTYWSITSD
jgi:phosphoesterase RecJ-like protein